MGFLSRVVALGLGGFLLLIGIGMFFVPTEDSGEESISVVCGSIFLILGIIMLLYGLFGAESSGAHTSVTATSSSSSSSSASSSASAAGGSAQVNIIMLPTQPDTFGEKKKREHKLVEMKEAILMAMQDGQITPDEMQMLDRVRSSLGLTVEEFNYCMERVRK